MESGGTDGETKDLQKRVPHSKNANAMHPHNKTKEENFLLSA
jgi:hypothetical protein